MEMCSVRVDLTAAASARARADRPCGSQPQILPRIAGRQRQDDAAPGLAHRRADLEQLQSQRRDLGASKLGTREFVTQLLEQYIRGGGEQHAHLVGEEARRAGAVDLQVAFELLDAVLDVAAL